MSYQVPEGKLYDLGMLEQMANGNQDFIKNMVKTFLEQTPEAVEEITVHFGTKDWESLRGVAHKIKPSMEIMGIVELKEDIKLIELNAKNQENLEQMPDLIEKLNVLGDAVFDQLREIS